MYVLNSKRIILLVSFVFPYILPKLEYSREEICHHMQYGVSNASNVNDESDIDSGTNQLSMIILLVQNLHIIYYT